MDKSQTRTINPTFDVSLEVYAQNVEKMQMAKKRFFALNRNGRKEEKDEALQDLKEAESAVDNLTYIVLHKTPQPALALNGGGGAAISNF